MFRYVFGGAIRVSSAGGYVDFLIPGIVGQTAAFATFATAIALAQELKKGVIDRLRSMPMARSAVLAGRLVADAGRMLVTILVLIGVGYAVGFRFHNGVGPAIAMIALATLFGLAIACISAFTGLAIGDEESVQAFGLIWIFPITFLSSAFVPIATMPGWLQAFANNQPVTYTIDAMRALAEGGPVEASLWKSLVWLASIFAVFGPLAVRAYRRASLAAALFPDDLPDPDPDRVCVFQSARRHRGSWRTSHDYRSPGPAALPPEQQLVIRSG